MPEKEKKVVARCPHCEKKLSASPRHLGKNVKCPGGWSLSCPFCR